MNKIEQAQQLRLAADIFETGHPFEVRHDTSEKWHPSRVTHPARAVLEGWHLRPILATPPDGRPLHNPDNLTAEQVGLGYRLGLQEESADQPHEVWDDGEWRKAFRGDLAFVDYASTYRVPLSVPWPQLPIATLAQDQVELTAEQHAAVEACLQDKAPPFQLPPPPPGMRWHREDGWKEGDLPPRYRPHVDGEKNQKGDEWKPIRNNASGHWVPVTTISGTGSNEFCDLYRTTRPLIFTHEGKEWTYHKPGDPMPCESKALIEAVYGEHCDSRKAEDYNWDARTSVFGWRYAEPETKQVELGPEDVPPGTVLRGAGEAHNYDGGWCIITSCSRTGIRIWRECDSNPTEITWRTIKDANSEINRSIPLTGRWNPDAWEPCHKTLANG